MEVNSANKFNINACLDCPVRRQCLAGLMVLTAIERDRGRMPYILGDVNFEFMGVLDNSVSMDDFLAEVRENAEQAKSSHDASMVALVELMTSVAKAHARWDSRYKESSERANALEAAREMYAESGCDRSFESEWLHEAGAAVIHYADRGICSAIEVPEA